MSDPVPRFLGRTSLTRFAFRAGFDRAGLDRGEGGANGAARVIPLVATAVLMAMFNER